MFEMVIDFIEIIQPRSNPAVTSISGINLSIEGIKYKEDLTGLNHDISAPIVIDITAKNNIG